MQFKIIDTNEEYKEAARLFKEYATWLNIDLSFQSFEKELKGLKEMYNDKDGGILLCKDGDEYIACVAVRRIDGDTAELKRMFVQQAHQHKGIGAALLQHALQLATALSYSVIRLDTLSTMTSAMDLYKKYGFYEIPPYYFNPEKTAVYFERTL